MKSNINKARRDIAKMSQGKVNQLNQQMEYADRLFYRKKQKKLHVRVLYHGCHLEDGRMTLQETKKLIFEYGKLKAITVSFNKKLQILLIKVR